MSFHYKARANRRKINQPNRSGKMNGTEALYASHLATLKLVGSIKDYYFQPINIRLAKNTFYQPDFMVVSESGEMEFHEVKAGMRNKQKPKRNPELAPAFVPIVEDDALVKIKVAAETLPLRFLMVWQDKKTGHWMGKEY